MPLTSMQQSVLETLKSFRDEGTYVAGGAALNRQLERLSDDMDIFGDRDELPQIVNREIDALKQRGMTAEITATDTWMVEAIVKWYGFETKVQWIADPETRFRYFPAQPDTVFGFIIHDIDNAVNKVLAASRRSSAARDIVDIDNIIRNIGPLAPIILAATGKPQEDRAPARIIQDMRNIAFGYTGEDYQAVALDGENDIDRSALLDRIGAALDEAADYFEDHAPLDHVECLFIDVDGRPFMATDDDIKEGTVTVMKIIDFSATPTFVD